MPKTSLFMKGGFLSSPAEDEMDSDHSACWKGAYSDTYCIYARSLASRDSLESDQEVKRDLWHGCFFCSKITAFKCSDFHLLERFKWRRRWWGGSKAPPPWGTRALKTCVSDSVRRVTAEDFKCLNQNESNKMRKGNKIMLSRVFPFYVCTANTITKTNKKHTQKEQAFCQW